MPARPKAAQSAFTLRPPQASQKSERCPRKFSLFGPLPAVKFAANNGLYAGVSILRRLVFYPHRAGLGPALAYFGAAWNGPPSACAEAKPPARQSIPTRQSQNRKVCFLKSLSAARFSPPCRFLRRFPRRSPPRSPDKASSSRPTGRPARRSGAPARRAARPAWCPRPSPARRCASSAR